jgi:hypothetical protein
MEGSKMATPRICSVTDCGKRHYARGACRAHYWRLKKYGNPIAGSVAKDAALLFINETVLPFDGDDCLKWPFLLKSNGYGRVSVNSRKYLAHRFVCELVNGNPPTPKHQAAHSCGNGHLGCVNPHHLSWKTPSENQADRIIHDTHCRGERHSNAKLTELQVLEIRRLIGAYRVTTLAKMFGVSKGMICHIVKKKAWAHV